MAIIKFVALCHNKYEHTIFFKWSTLLIPVAVLFSVFISLNIGKWTNTKCVFDNTTFFILLSIWFIGFWVSHIRKTSFWVGLGCAIFQWVSFFTILALAILIVSTITGSSSVQKKEK